MRRTQEAGADQVGKSRRADYDVPEDWRSAWGSAIEAVRADSDFQRHHEGHCGKCNDSDATEKSSHPFLIETANAALSVLPPTIPFPDFLSTTIIMIRRGFEAG